MVHGDPVRVVNLLAGVLLFLVGFIVLLAAVLAELQ